MKLLLASLLVLSGPSSFGQDRYRYAQPMSRDDGWQTAHLKALNMDSTQIYQLFDQLRHGEHNLHAILLVKDGQLVVEEYFGSHDADKQHDLRSVTKSITSLLMGIAIDRGFINDIDDPISTYLKFPVPKKNLDERKGHITIRHLLTMSTGLDCDDWDEKSKGQEDRVYRKKDWLQYFLDLPVENDPGKLSAYCTMAQVLAMEIINRASGMPINEFADRYLFKPLGIDNLSWGHTSGKDVIASAKRLYMIPRDMAKIGQLVLNKGTWKGERIVSAEWIERSTTAHTKITGMDYGFLWWSVPLETNGKTVMTKAATGNGGQYIFIFPEWELVAVFTGGAYNSQEDKLPFAIVRDVFLPAAFRRGNTH